LHKQNLFDNIFKVHYSNWKGGKNYEDTHRRFQTDEERACEGRHGVAENLVLVDKRRKCPWNRGEQGGAIRPSFFIPNLQKDLIKFIY
jgi:hypothetical protein